MDKHKYLEQAKRIILNRLSGYQCQVFLFGSHARRRAGERSDIDIAVMPQRPIPRGLLSEIREELEESTIPYSVDLVDLSRASPQLVSQAREEGILWSS